MTPAERALLLAVAKSHARRCPSYMVETKQLWGYIAAVEAEAAPKTEAPTEDKSCETCARFVPATSVVRERCARPTYLAGLCGDYCKVWPHWKPKETGQ